MKQTLALLSLILTFSPAFAQTEFEPEVLVLTPNQVTYDKAFTGEIVKYTNDIRHNKNYTDMGKRPKSKKPEKLQNNYERMAESERLFGISINFSKSISVLCEQFLIYRFIEEFPQAMILLSNRKSTGNISELKKIADSAKLQYIVNFPAIHFYKQEGRSYAALSVQLYDGNTNKIVIDTSYTGDWNNPGFEFSCDDSTISCTINNSMAPALEDIVNNIISNNPSRIKKIKLARERVDVLAGKYLNQPYDKDFIAGIIPATDTNINLKSIYTAFVNNDKTKFAAFFLESGAVQDFSMLNGNNKDKNVQIITEKSIKDSGYFNSVPQTYAYIVKAVQYKGKWYYTKTRVTYFVPHDDEQGRLQFLNNLQELNFFKEGSTDFNPEFWETELFAKIKDLRKDPDWKLYGKGMWKHEEEENRKYIGMYEIVADQLKREANIPVSERQYIQISPGN